MRRSLFILTLLAGLGGCTSFDVKRLAPPGIIKYERIADQKEPNPAIVDIVAAQRADTDAKFPKIGETQAAGPRPTPLARGEVDAATDDLLEDAERANDAAQSDREAAEQDGANDAEALEDIRDEAAQ
ncbi:MAG: hypothetical protein AAFW81_06310 [Pseudomonadota bacterium]